MEYKEFLEKKRNISENHGFKYLFMPDNLFDFQKELVEWSLLKGRSALFEDCGLGKSFQELVWCQNVIEHTNNPVLLLTPLAVSMQMLQEAEKFNIPDVERSKNGKFSKKLIITNYESLHNFDANDFSGVVCDESSILKNFDGAYKQEINIFMRKIKYRLLATATAAPNDYIELGTSSEALGYLGYMDMLSKFFKNEANNSSTKSNSRNQVKWRLKGHAHDHFWRWVTSWSRAIRKPSDLGYDDNKFILPKLNIKNHLLKLSVYTPDGYFPEFSYMAIGLQEERQEIRQTITDRCEEAANKVNNTNGYAVIWCNLNDEGDLLDRLIPDAVQISGRDSDESKEEKLINFSNGKIRVMIIKPKIGSFGLNWQHCNHVIFFPTHSYEQFYQAIRRCWRFGQKREVNVDVIYSEGFENVIYNLERKQKQAEKMFEHLVKEMNNSINIDRYKKYNLEESLPSWL
jgi:SNF2 family DNA or RNA helicase